MIPRKEDSASSHKLLILIIVLLVAIIGLLLIQPLLYLLNEQPDKTFTSIEYVDLIEGENEDLLIIHLKNSGDAPISKYTLTLSTNIRCKSEEEGASANSTKYRKTLRITCTGDFVNQSGDVWNGTLIVFLMNNRTETHILSVKARNIGCLGCPKLTR